MKIDLKNKCLPGFVGFYETGLYCDERLTDDSDYAIETLTGIESQHFTKDQQEFIIDNYDNYIDYQANRLAVSKVFNDLIEKELQILDLIESLDFFELVSPKEYNFVTDKIYSNFKGVNMQKIIKFLKDNKKEFKQVLIDNFKSRDGFNSFVSYDFDDCIDFLTNEINDSDASNNFYFTVALSFFLEKEAGITDFLDEIYYDCSEKIFIGDFFDYDKFLNDFNQEFNLNLKNFDDIIK